MTWLWFALIGFFALISRKSVSGWLENWSVDALKRLAAGGLVAFGAMGTFGLGLGAQPWWLHAAAGLGGVLGFFALSEIANRRSASERFAQYEKFRTRMSNLGEQPVAEPAETEEPETAQREEVVSKSARAIPPLIKENDSEKSILDLLTTAAEQWDNPEVDIGSASEPAELSTQKTHETVAQILKRAGEETAPEEPIFSPELQANRVSETAPEPAKPSPEMRETELPEDAKVGVKPLAANEEVVAPQRETTTPKPPEHDEPAEETERKAEPPATATTPAASEPSAIDRASGPISLDATPVGEPVGPLSLKPKPARRSSAESGSAKPAPFVYRPLLVTSRLGGTDTGSDKDETKEEPGEQEEQDLQPGNPAGEPTTDD